ncbi:DNA primase [Hymenobacter properus]|uniref:DNA primase n=1 Tax=Hymenobacter properus TaxID=2791026 RepID=A0A931BEW4_9BACT|nr:DNA primase [Hymenobacter properus]MBF9140062.1 DNA primase [Hymenobacter properus]MBR7718869.1 DNA primase [Microvirga sp. SRT04]
MARIPKELVDHIIQTADIVEVVGDFVQLKRKGQNLWAPCPFHNEKSPSFSVNPAKSLYKCFGCGKAGGVVQFVMDVEGTSYVEALKYLARKYAIEIQEEEKTPQQQLEQNERDSQFIVSDFAKNHYHRLLLNSEEGMSIGYGYLKERGLNLSTIQTFELGYSLDAWDDLMKAAEAAGYDKKYLEKTGLTVIRTDDQGKDTGRRYDRFRGRVMFPIHNISGRVVGFGARTLKRDDKMAKYLNSPESEIYHKSDVLYGLFQARQAIRTQEVCYLVEGYLDVLSLYQGGIKNVVASSGTSLTEGQIRLIKRYSDNVTVLYDGDAAGIKASLRGTDLLLEGGLNVRVVLFPDGDDPDSYIRKVGDQRFTEYIETKSQDFISFKTTLVAREASGDPVKKAEAIRDVLHSIAKVPDAIKRQVFLQQTSATFGIDEQVLITEYNKLVKTASQKAPDGRPQPGGENRGNYGQGAGSANTGYPPSSTPRPAPAARPMTDEEEAEMLMYGGAEAAESLGNSFAAAPAKAAEQEPMPDMLQVCEREVLRLLVLYAGREIDNEMSVAGYLMGQLGEYPLTFPLYAEMWEICRQELLAGRFPDARQLAQNEREDIRQLITDLATERYEISPNWRTKEIYVFNEVDLPQLACDNAVLRLNKVHVQRELDQCLEKLRHPLEDAEMFEILGDIKRLKELDNELAGLLGTVVGRSA